MNYTKLFAYFREQKAFTAFLSALMVISTVSAVFAGRYASAATIAIRNVSDTLDNARISTGAVTQYSIHKFVFQPKVDIAEGSPLSFKFYPNADVTNFDLSLLSLGSDIAVAGKTVNATLGACGAADFMATVAADQLDLTPCVGHGVMSSSTVYTVTIGSAAGNKIVNPQPTSATAANYMIELFNTATTQSTRIRVALVENVDVTAQVDPIFDFTVSGIASTTVTSYGAITTDSSTSTINYGILPVNVAQTAAQMLQVKTNARQGFNVTVVSDQPFQSQNGAIIDGLAASAPAAWSVPTANVNDDITWGHIGVSSDDTAIPNGGIYAYAGQAYTGDFVRGTAVSIFGNASSTAGVGSGTGTTTVYYKTEISPLQEAATDYHMNLIYVATPTF
ncbi:MAG TPA: hypothetical protein VJ579_04325 [Candidatus Paceibacterota bacterium]|nr:hypothetical protein [Candidatus Paceibacterota bacterium]